MTVFVATSKRFYDEAEQVVERIKACNVMVHHPYFHSPCRLPASMRLLRPVSERLHRLQCYHRAGLCLCQRQGNYCIGTTHRVRRTGAGYGNKQPGSIRHPLWARVIIVTNRKSEGRWKKPNLCKSRNFFRATRKTRSGRLLWSAWICPSLLKLDADDFVRSNFKFEIVSDSFH